VKRFKNILVVINDDNPQESLSLARGLTLAKKNKARLTLMDVIPAPEQAISEYEGIIKPEELTAMLVERREETLMETVKQLDAKIDIDIKVKIGQNFIEIVRQVVFGKHDILIKAANEHPESFDSSDFHLMRKCPQPVWLLRGSHQKKLKKILATIDLQLETHEEGKALNHEIMELASSLAKWENSELHILSCWSLPGESHLRNGAFMRVSEEELNQMIQEEERANRQLQDALVARYDISKAQSHLVKARPEIEIPRFSKDENIDVMVMGTVARSGIPGLLIGNTSETILSSISCSVLTLKPGGFESIIK